MERLDELFSQLDDWFTDITLNEPISQFKLENEDLVTSRPNSSNLVKNKGNTRKLVRQAKTTNQKQRKTIAKNSLDSLTKDLEQLLEEHETEPKVEVRTEAVTYLHDVYSDDDETLLDETVGYCCTLIKPNKLEHDYRPVITNHIEEYSGDSRLNQQTHDDQMKLAKNQRIYTVTPLDHDYLPRVSKSRPLSSNNSLIRSQNQRRNRIGTAASMITSPPTCVLNMEALKRFARFSDRIEMLTKIES